MTKKKVVGSIRFPNEMDVRPLRKRTVKEMCNVSEVFVELVEPTRSVKTVCVDKSLDSLSASCDVLEQLVKDAHTAFVNVCSPAPVPSLDQTDYTPTGVSLLNTRVGSIARCVGVCNTMLRAFIDSCDL